MSARFTLALLPLLVTLIGCSRADLQSVARAADHQDPAQDPARRSSMSTVRIRVVGPDGKLTQPLERPRLILTDAEWQKRLTPKQYVITRGKGTEPPFCGGLLENKAPGVYVCVGCNLPLFESTTKFESGSGWPSFFQPIARENIHEELDRSHGVACTEILCRRCDAHLGHVFDDGPAPSGLRYCLNSDAMRFVASDQIKTLAEAVSVEPTGDKASAGDRAEAVFAGGCFWCVEAVFRQLDGVLDAVSGYAGGSAETANYKAVCSGDTGHAESVKIVYSPKKISYEQLLKVHFATHDPTTWNQQGLDVGTQYRSAIFFANDEQKRIARAFIADLNAAKVFKTPIVTTLEPLVSFYPAEAKHQNYVACNLANSYVQSVALPKVRKAREQFEKLLKPSQDPATPPGRGQ